MTVKRRLQLTADADSDKLFFAMAVDHRQSAQARISDLIALLRSSGNPQAEAIVVECEALSKAIGAFHMEGIRFRIYNVDRLLRVLPSPPSGATAQLEDARTHLEAAGFHTRSHQAPG